MDDAQVLATLLAHAKSNGDATALARVRAILETELPANGLRQPEKTVSKSQVNSSLYHGESGGGSSDGESSSASSDDENLLKSDVVARSLRTPVKRKPDEDCAMDGKERKRPSLASAGDVAAGTRGAIDGVATRPPLEGPTPREPTGPQMVCPNCHDKVAVAALQEHLGACC